MYTVGTSSDCDLTIDDDPSVGYESDRNAIVPTRRAVKPDETAVDDDVAIRMNDEIPIEGANFASGDNVY